MKNELTLSIKFQLASLDKKQLKKSKDLRAAIRTIIFREASATAISCSLS